MKVQKWIGDEYFQFWKQKRQSRWIGVFAGIFDPLLWQLSERAGAPDSRSAVPF